MIDQKTYMYLTMVVNFKFFEQYFWLFSKYSLLCITEKGILNQSTVCSINSWWINCSINQSCNQTINLSINHSRLLTSGFLDDEAAESLLPAAVSDFLLSADDVDEELFKSDLLDDFFIWLSAQRQQNITKIYTLLYTSTAVTISCFQIRWENKR